MTMELSPDMVEAWSSHPVTEALFEMVTESKAGAVQSCLSYVASESFHQASQAGGYMSAMEDIEDWVKAQRGGGEDDDD